MYRSSRLPRHRGGRATTPSRYIDGQGPLPRRGPPRDLEPRRLCSHFPFRRDARKPQFRMPHGNLRRGDTPRGQVRTCGRRRGRYISFACSPCADCILSHLGRFVKSCSRVTNQQKLGVQTDFDALFRPTLGGMNKKTCRAEEAAGRGHTKNIFFFCDVDAKKGAILPYRPRKYINIPHLRQVRPSRWPPLPRCPGGQRPPRSARRRPHSSGYPPRPLISRRE